MDVNFAIETSFVANESDLSDSELISIVDGSKPASTKRQTKFGITKFMDWLNRRPKLSISLESSTPAELNHALRKFYIEVSFVKQQ